jgi:hypothetical protein
MALLVRTRGAPILARRRRRRRHGVFAAASSLPLPASPRIAAQLPSADEDAGFETLENATSSWEDCELVEEVSNGFFFAVARVPPPPPPPEDPSSVPAARL